MNEPHGSGSTDDMYDDLDSLFNPEAAGAIESKQEVSSNVSDKTADTRTSVPSQSLSTSNFSLNEDQLKKEEMILYLDLVVTEFDNKKALSNLKTEYINLKKEADTLRKSLNEKDEKISRLTAEVTTLKKNICSLYKTAKSEIEQKDAMLQEANQKIDKRYSRSDRSAFQYKQYSAESSQCQPSTSGMSGMPSQDFMQHEAWDRSKESQNYENNKKRSYENSRSEKPAFTRPSTSFNPSENRSKWNRVTSKHKFPHSESEKRKHSPSPDTFNEKCNVNNYRDSRNNYSKSKNDQINHSMESSSKKQKHGS